MNGPSFHPGPAKPSRIRQVPVKPSQATFAASQDIGSVVEALPMSA